MSYSQPADVRRLTGITDITIVTEEDLLEFIVDADASIDDKITVPTPVPRLIKRLSSLLAAIDVYTRPDLRVGFKSADLTVTTQDIEKSLVRWKNEANGISSRYRTGAAKVKSSSYAIIDEDSRYA